MSVNDIIVRPPKQQILIGERDSFTYGYPVKPQSHSNSVRRAQAFALRKPNAATVVWPCSYIEMDVPKKVEQDGTLA